jgi:hypothetical protein
MPEHSRQAIRWEKACAKEVVVPIHELPSGCLPGKLGLRRHKRGTGTLSRAPFPCLYRAGVDSPNRSLGPVLLLAYLELIVFFFPSCSPSCSPAG